MAGSQLPPSSSASESARRSATAGTGTSPVPYTHADFTYVRRKRTGKHEDEESHELNIVPYLDILVNLIMFLLVAQATLVSLGLVDVSAPSYASIGPTGSPNPNEKPLRLTIGIANRGFYIAATGTVLPGQENQGDEITPAGVHRAEPTVPKKPDGTQDFATLTQKLRAIKTVFPKNEAVYIAADDNVPYDVLVKTLDASREDSTGPLFPQVAFTQIN